MSEPTYHAEVGPLIRISLPYLIDLRERLDQLSALQGGTYMDNMAALYGAKNAFEQFAGNSIYSSSVRTSRESVRQLVEHLQVMVDIDDFEREIPPRLSAQTRNLSQNLRTILVSELAVWPSYFVSPKGGYDTLALLDDGEVLFPKDLRVKVPESVFDATEATKAVAFEMGTAAGFHVYRCLEAVLRRYWEAVSGGAAPPKVRSIGVYVAAIEKDGCGDQKVLAALKQINQLHRNPLIHPEVALDMEETITAFGLARSAISEMLKHLPDAATTTTNPGV
ncbi:hypothetical protein GC169_05690 [bacterium]|nr:hypothetical protein [bacterium]